MYKKNVISKSEYDTTKIGNRLTEIFVLILVFLAHQLTVSHGF